MKDMIEVLGIIKTIVKTVVEGMDDFRFALFAINSYLTVMGIAIIIIGEASTPNLLCLALNSIASVSLFAVQMLDMMKEGNESST